MESIIEAVASKDKVQIVGFGTFEARERKEKIGKTQEQAKKSKSQLL
ncbi:MAG: HU family DNA-binding protein [Acutalibacteraceae bacterium]